MPCVVIKFVTCHVVQCCPMLCCAVLCVLCCVLPAILISHPPSCLYSLVYMYWVSHQLPMVSLRLRMYGRSVESCRVAKRITEAELAEDLDLKLGVDGWFMG